MPLRPSSVMDRITADLTKAGLLDEGMAMTAQRVISTRLPLPGSFS